MIIELFDIKEVEITEKPEIKHYMLFSYCKDIEDPDKRYFLLTQSPLIKDIDEYKRSWKLGKGEEFRVFSVMLPM